MNAGLVRGLCRQGGRTKSSTHALSRPRSASEEDFEAQQGTGAQLPSRRRGTGVQPLPHPRVAPRGLSSEVLVGSGASPEGGRNEPDLGSFGNCQVAARNLFAVRPRRSWFGTSWVAARNPFTARCSGDSSSGLSCSGRDRFGTRSGCSTQPLRSTRCGDAGRKAARSRQLPRTQLDATSV